jgi:MFS family permease
VPLLARDIGASTSQVALMVALFQAAALVANIVFGRWADFGNRKVFVVGGLAATGLAVTAHLFARSLGGLYAVRALTGLAMGVYPAALIAYYYDRTGKLGRFTGFGSLGWGVGSILAGALAIGWVFPVAGAILGVTTMIALLGLRSQHVRLDQPFFDSRVLRRNWRLYLAFYLRHTGAFSIWAVFPLLISDYGASRLWVGVIFAINPLSQVPFMNLLERFQSRSLVRIGLVLSAFVFASYALAPNFWWLIPVQAALALSWAYLYLGSMKRLMERNPERSTAAGMFQSLFGLSAVSGALLAGITGAFGYRVLVLVAAGLALAGAAVFWNAPDDG